MCWIGGVYQSKSGQKTQSNRLPSTSGINEIQNLILVMKEPYRRRTTSAALH